MTCFLQLISVELSLFLFAVCYHWMSDFDTNLYLQKTCRFNATTEPDLSTRCDDEKRGIVFVAQVNSRYHAIVILACMLVTILATSWSDKSGRRRRPLMYFAYASFIAYTLSGCLNAYFWQWTPISSVVAFIILVSLSGGPFMIYLACCVYICDFCSEQNRTMRLGFLAAINYISVVLGRGGSGFILHSLGFFYSYLLCFVISTCGLILGVVFIKDTSVMVEKKIPLYAIFNVKQILIGNFKVVFNRSLGRKRIVVSLLIMASISSEFSNVGEFSVLYPYLRYRFGLNERDYSTFMFCKYSVSTLGLLFSSIVLSKFLKIPDGIIITFASICNLTAAFGFLFATKMWQLYTITFLTVLRGVGVSVSWSFMSKHYSIDEMGRLSAVKSIFFLILPLSYSTYNTIFQKTMDSFPSAFCLLSISLNMIFAFTSSGSYFLSKKIGDKKVENETAEEKDTMIVPERREIIVNKT